VFSIFWYFWKITKTTNIPSYTQSWYTQSYDLLIYPPILWESPQRGCTPRSGWTPPWWGYAPRMRAHTHSGGESPVGVASHRYGHPFQSTWKPMSVMVYPRNRGTPALRGVIIPPSWG
jgi:hypothetical protein